MPLNTVISSMVLRSMLKMCSVQRAFAVTKIIIITDQDCKSHVDSFTKRSGPPYDPPVIK
jgi:hypothetical protein